MEQRLLADPKPASRVKDPGVFRVLHLEWRECALCGSIGPLSLHHVSKHPRDDLRSNLVMVCGSGTTGCHGLIESRNFEKLRELGEYLLEHRPDTIEYLRAKRYHGDEWIRQNLLLAFRL